MIVFNKPYFSGKELKYVQEALTIGKISGDGFFTHKCHNFFEQKYGFHKVLLTTSCTDALEMAAILLDIKEGDEVLAPSYTFVSTVNAFVLRGAKIIFVDSQRDHPNMDATLLEDLITPKTKVILPVHYAGNACDMDTIMDIARKHNLFVVEDAAQAIDGYYTSREGNKLPLGSIGHLGVFSFHETKNIIAGEGGLLAINDEKFASRAEIIWEKGTNRSQFFRGEVDKYGWVDIGSSFLPSDITGAILYAQLEQLKDIQDRRKQIWQTYYKHLLLIQAQGFVNLPITPNYSTNNAHMFYILCRDLEQRSIMIDQLKQEGIHAVFHYLSLHKSPYYHNKHDGRSLPNSDRFSDTLLRLPMYYEVEEEKVIEAVLKVVQKIKHE